VAAEPVAGPPADGGAEAAEHEDAEVDDDRLECDDCREQPGQNPQVDPRDDIDENVGNHTPRRGPMDWKLILVAVST